MKKMLKFSQFVTESVDSTLYVYDIDDTLFKTNARIYVKDLDGKIVKNLSNQEFNTHKLLPGQSYEFSEFTDSDKFDRTSRPIKKMIDNVKDTQKMIEGTSSKIIFLTARADFDDKERFLNVFRKRNIDMDKIHVYRAGNDLSIESTAEKKAKVIRDYLFSNKFTKTCMYDDNVENLEGFKDLQVEFPNVSFDAYQVFHDGSTKRV